MREALIKALEDNQRLLREIGLRYDCPQQTGPPAQEASSSPEAVQALCRDMQELAQEQVRAVLLNTKMCVMDVLTIYQGTVDQSPLRVAEVLRPAIVANRSVYHPGSQSPVR